MTGRGNTMAPDSGSKDEARERAAEAAPARGADRGAARGERPAEPQEAVFDVADFAAIARFAGIGPRRRGG